MSDNSLKEYHAFAQSNRVVWRVLLALVGLRGYYENLPFNHLYMRVNF